MFSNKQSQSISFLISALVLVGIVACQAPPNNNSRNIGRLGRGPIAYGNNGQPQPMSSGLGSTLWGQITDPAGDQDFQNNLMSFTAPMLQGLASNQQLGYVASQQGQSTGVFFWGQAPLQGAGSGLLQGGGGTLNGASARIHIEIWDSNAGQTGSDGTQTPPVVVHIGYDQQGFVSAQGSVQGGMAQLVFTDSMGSVYMNGSISGQTFTGTIGYSNAYTGANAAYTIGQFSVPACGFFVCN